MCCCSTQKTTKTLVCACVCVWVSQMYLCVSVYVYVGDCKMRMYPTVVPFFSLLSFPQARCINLFMLVFTWTAPICRLTKYKLLFTPCLTYSFFHAAHVCLCLCICLSILVSFLPFSSCNSVVSTCSLIWRPFYTPQHSTSVCLNFIPKSALENSTSSAHRETKKIEKFFLVGFLCGWCLMC